MTNSHHGNSVEKSMLDFNPPISNTTDLSYTNDLDYNNCIADVLSTAQAPISIEELISKVGYLLPKGEDKGEIVKRSLENLYQAVEVTPNQYQWLTNLIDGTVIRHPLAAEEARQGFLLMDELEHALFFPEFFQTHRPSDRILYIELFGGPTIPAEAYIERKTWSLRLGSQFVEWIDRQGGQGRDDIIIMVDDAAEGRYTLRLHPREARDNSTIQNRNVQLTLLAEELVNENHYGRGSMTTWNLAAYLLARDAYRDSIPPDDLHCVLHQYSLLHFDSSMGYTLKEDSVGKVGSHEKQERFSHSLDDGRTEDDKYDFPALGEHMSTSLSDELSDELSATEDDYDRYLDKLIHSGILDSPFTEQEFNVLRAELESLNTLEQQFGYLLSEQRNRQHDLSTCLLVDANSVKDEDADMPNHSDLDEPPCWEN